MADFDFDLSAYLKRINYEAEISITIECLKSLHCSQLYTIPFENFDIHLGRPIDLEPKSLFSKLVESHRGGYCFELSGIFLLALNKAGFNARPLLGLCISLEKQLEGPIRFCS